MNFSGEADKFLKIAPEFLPAKAQVYPFHLYLASPNFHSIQLFLKANSPLSEEKKKILKEHLSQGGFLAISKGQMRTFLLDTKTEERKFLAFNDGASTLEEVGDLGLRNDMAKVIGQIATNLSPGLALELVKGPPKGHQVPRVFQENVLALSLLLSLECGLNDPQLFEDLICASYLHHLGMTVLARHLASTPTLKLAAGSLAEYMTHPGLSLHVLKKFGPDLSPRALALIRDHHERADGKGLPAGKKGDQNDPLCLVFAFSSHLAEFAEGMISGEKTPLKAALKLYRDRAHVPGLELEFGEAVRRNISSLIHSPFPSLLSRHLSTSASS